MTLATVRAALCNTLRTTKDTCKNKFGFGGTLTITSAFSHRMGVSV